MRPDVAIAGYGDAYSERDNQKSSVELAFESARKALDDASLERDQIDGLVTGRRPIADRRPQWNNIFANYMNIRPRYNTEVTSHGAGVGGTLKHAAAAIHGGFAEKVLCLSADSPYHAGDMVEEVGEGLDADPEFETPYGHLIPGMYALSATRYLHEYDVTKEQLAKFSVENRKWGTKHPRAMLGDKGEITVEDVLESQPIASPLNLLNCAPWRRNGTGGAFIVTSADRAEDRQDTPIYVRGVGEYDTHEYITGLLEYKGRDEDKASLTLTGAREASRQAYDMAGMGPEDMDMLQLHSNFTHIGLLELEDLGFAEKGKAGEFVEDGGIDYDGGLPVNTNGGPLTFGQAGIVPDTITEAVRQLRGEALGEQVEDPETALVHLIGGMCACHTVSILSTERGASA